METRWVSFGLEALMETVVYYMNACCIFSMFMVLVIGMVYFLKDTVIDPIIKFLRSKHDKNKRI